jgi:C4-dicarboxylate-specific signal transduction histidine kinase
LTDGPLGYPLEPGSEAVPKNAAPGGRREGPADLRLVHCASSTSDIDHLSEICHEMRQHVTNIIELADAALSHAAISSSVRGHLGRVRDQAEWFGDLLQGMVESPETRTAETGSYDLIALASDLIQIETVSYEGDLVFQWYGGDMCVFGNSIELRRAIVNLLSNATRAAGPDGKVVVELRRTVDRVLLTIDDSGPGFGLIRRGVGLGLHAVARGLKTYGGGLEYSQSPLGGVRAILALRAANISGGVR